MDEGLYERAHRLKDGAVLVYTRPGAKQTNYQARLKVPGVTGYVTKSLKTRDLNTAITEAEDLYHQLKAEQRLGIDVKIARASARRARPLQSPQLQHLSEAEDRWRAGEGV